MKNRVFLLLLIAAMLLAAGFFPRTKASPAVPGYQHKIYPRENEGETGFQPDGSLKTHLPIIILHNEGKTIPGADYKDRSKIFCSYSVIDSRSAINCSSDEPDIRGTAQISVRGNTSRNSKKKQYSLKLADAQGLPEDRALLGLPKESIWVLNGSYIDRSLIRNYLCYSVAGRIMDYAPGVRLCELFTTNSQGHPVYQGVYSLLEKPKVSDRRLNLPPYDPKIDESSFLVQMNAKYDFKVGLHIDNNPIAHLSPDNAKPNNMELEYPGEDIISPETKDYIQRRIYFMDRLLYDSVHTDVQAELNEFLDLNSFIDYYLINEFFQNYDAGSLSTYFYQSPGGRIHIGPVWDFDGALNNFIIFGIELSVDQLSMHESYYYSMLLQNKEFTDRCISRYYQLRQGVLSEEQLLEFIDGAAEYLGSAALRNSKRWYNDKNGESFYRDIREMKEFVIERGAWMDENFEAMIHLDK